MTKGKLFITTVVCLIGLITLAYYLYPKPIESNIQSRVVAQLKAKKVNWAKVIIDGRDVTLSGQALNSGSIDKAIDIVNNIEGVRSVTNNASVVSSVQLASDSVAKPLPTLPEELKIAIKDEPKKPEPQKPIIVEKEVEIVEPDFNPTEVPDHLTIPNLPDVEIVDPAENEYSKPQFGFELKSDELIVNGYVGKQLVKDNMVSYLKQTYKRAKITNNVSINDKLPQGWSKAVSIAVAYPQILGKDVTANIDKDIIKFSGKIKGFETYQRMEQEIKSHLPSGFMVEYQLDIKNNS